jgi:hemerythrin-like domain-containing protein
MTTVTQPLRDEHRELLPELELLRSAGDAVGFAPPEEVTRKVSAALSFLQRHLIPHAQAEEAALYPTVDRLLGSPKATATMRREHVEVARLTAELASRQSAIAGGNEADLVQVRRLLYGLYAVVGVHFAKEEEVYLPILDEHLSSAEATAMFGAMESAAATAKAGVA